MYPSPEQVIYNLQLLKVLFEKPSSWTRWNATTPMGIPVDPTDPRATAWSLSGGINYLIPEMIQNVTVRRALRRTILQLAPPSVVNSGHEKLYAFNDSYARSHQDILDLIDLTIIAIQNTKGEHYAN